MRIEIFKYRFLLIEQFLREQEYKVIILSGFFGNREDFINDEIVKFFI